MSNEKKEELMSLFICLSSILIILIAISSRLIDEETEMHAIYITFIILLSVIKPFSGVGLAICSAPVILSVILRHNVDYSILAEVVEITVYYLIGGILNKSLARYTVDGKYMKFLGYQVFIITCGSVAWLVIISMTKIIGMCSVTIKDIIVEVLNKISVIMLHMLVCNKSLTNYFADRVKED